MLFTECRAESTATSATRKPGRKNPFFDRIDRNTRGLDRQDDTYPFCQNKTPRAERKDVEQILGHSRLRRYAEWAV